MRTYSVPNGEDIRITAVKMVALADETGEDVECKFNGSTIKALPGNSTQEIVDQYWSKAPERP